MCAEHTFPAWQAKERFNLLNPLSTQSGLQSGHAGSRAGTTVWTETCATGCALLHAQPRVVQAGVWVPAADMPSVGPEATDGLGIRLTHISWRCGRLDSQHVMYWTPQRLTLCTLRHGGLGSGKAAQRARASAAGRRHERALRPRRWHPCCHIEGRRGTLHASPAPGVSCCKLRCESQHPAAPKAGCPCFHPLQAAWAGAEL